MESGKKEVKEVRLGNNTVSINTKLVLTIVSFRRVHYLIRWY